MTNYNERPDEILHGITGSKNLRPQRGILAHSRIEAKQAIKRLVADEMLGLMADEPLTDAEILHTTGYTDDEGTLRICKCGADYSDSKRKVVYNECRAELRTKLAEWLGKGENV